MLIIIMIIGIMPLNFERGRERQTSQSTAAAAAVCQRFVFSGAQTHARLRTISAIAARMFVFFAKSSTLTAQSSRQQPATEAYAKNTSHATARARFPDRPPL